MNFNKHDLKNSKITIMGLGLHGGGLASAIFFAERGACVTVTDLRSKEVLRPTLEKLQAYDMSFTLGEHRIKDFSTADIVIKNPAVPASSPFLKIAKRVETDISVFLALNKRPVIAVTGSKGKSTTVSALHTSMLKALPDVKLGGNITVSPLTFAEDCMTKSSDPVILELSSWQLADLGGKGLLKPKTAVITNIMPDHQNRYSSIEEYAADKKLIYHDIPPSGCLVCNFDDAYGRIFAQEAQCRILFVSGYPLPVTIDGLYLKDGEGYIQLNGKSEKILPADIRLTGDHNKINLLFAAAAMYREGMSPGFIGTALAEFKGIPHRMEKVAVVNGATWYNDSASTIPQATMAALQSISGHIQLICGGTDKKLNYDGFAAAVHIPDMTYLLEGTATHRMIHILEKEGVPFKGPFTRLQEAVTAAYLDSAYGNSVLFSPGATSFGMFLNEFDRGDRFREMVLKLNT